MPVGVAVLCALAVIHPLATPAAHPWVAIAIIVTGVMAVRHGIRRNAPTADSGWQRFARWLGVYAAGDIAYVLLDEVVGASGVAPIAWYVGLVAAVVAVSGLHRVLAVGDRVADGESRIDAVIAALAVGAVGWHVVVRPQLQALGWADYGVFGTAALWLGTVAVMAFVIKRALHDGHWSASLAAVAVAAPLTALTSLVYAVHESHLPWSSAPVSRPIMAISYAAIAFATWHPSMRRAPTVEHDGTPVRSRLALVALGICLLPAWHLLAVIGLMGIPRPDAVGTLLLMALALVCVWRVRVTLRARDLSAAALTRQVGEDPLTGLPNRTRLMAALQCAVERAGDVDDVALIALDLDRFKTVNDSLGHPVGDRLLVLIADRLREVVGDQHLIARLGGDEFVILCEGMGDHGAVELLADRVRTTVGAPIELSGHALGTTVSVGVACLGPGTRTAEDLLRDADVALYRAKDAGRDGVVVFDATLRHRAVSRMRTERELRWALAHDGLALAYQPVRDVVDGHITGAEALLRWADPEQHEATPQDMIDVAEETGLIDAVGEWVLRRAVGDLAGMLATAPSADLKVGINVSGLQLRRPGFAEMVLLALDDVGVAPHHLVLELTESVLIEDWTGPRATMRLLRAAGVMITMDDFGTGYAALAILRRFPFNSVKIDRGFISDLHVPDDGAGKAIVRAMIGMAHGLGMRVVAEGVERPEHIEVLRELGCDLMQGYLLNRPMPWSELEPALPTTARSPRPTTV